MAEKTSKTDKNKLTAAIMGVGQDRASGVKGGDAVNVPEAKTATDGQVASGGDSSAHEQAKPQGEGQGGAPEKLTARINLLCTPTEKKHLKRLALDLSDGNVSKLIYWALVDKGYIDKRDAEN
ncbi:hypothetical protein [uncultured Tateyamaria sp.]|uniref:hypothetical protein n=1 Tax=uncultured Tateyamaria sp. TaxID=455651 RepID=UPI00260F7720|nr:hypothetical protein [uncultured Tateyamaria sp.]